MKTTNNIWKQFAQNTNKIKTPKYTILHMMKHTQLSCPPELRCENCDTYYTIYIYISHT